ncbi:hypothetical protein [Reyranella sp.]|uniref:hypothetical protein n=1 Tax=Reyranella sp. TaxID=1929291 RepID=UPI003C7A804F
MADVIGPTSTMPGSSHRLPDDATCDLHLDRPAVARIQGETDSMGAELNDMCRECLDEHRAYVRNADTSGTCDWCKQHAPKRFNRRDYDEGMAGPLYQVCRGCIDRQNREIEKELARYDDI